MTNFIQFVKNLFSLSWWYHKEGDCCGGNCCGGFDEGEENTQDIPEQIFKVTITHTNIVTNIVQEIIVENVFNFLVEEEENTGSLIVDLDLKDGNMKRIRINRNLWISVVAE